MTVDPDSLAERTTSEPRGKRDNTAHRLEDAAEVDDSITELLDR